MLQQRMVLVVAVALLLAACERPPMESVQRGYRGVGMVQIDNPKLTQNKLVANQAPAALPAVPDDGPRASETFQNVQVLGHLGVGEFTRLMTAITNWVSPEQGCNYCHVVGGDLASDELYTKVVSRRMLEMTQHINSKWQNHVAATGVTCYTCHRGQPVPGHIWFEGASSGGKNRLLASRYGQNIASDMVGFTSLPYDPFGSFLGAGNEIRVVSTTALPAGNTHNIKQTEHTYGLMMHLSEALGVNCTFCHNSRSFLSWDQSAPQRQTAWYGIRLVRDLNEDYLKPLAEQLPSNRLGPRGDAPKLNCSTCHQGVNKPLNGANMLQDYPSLGHVTEATAAAATQEQSSPMSPPPQVTPPLQVTPPPQVTTDPQVSPPPQVTTDPPASE